MASQARTEHLRVWLVAIGHHSTHIAGQERRSLRGNGQHQILAVLPLDDFPVKARAERLGEFHIDIRPSGQGHLALPQVALAPLFSAMNAAHARQVADIVSRCSTVVVWTGLKEASIHER